MSWRILLPILELAHFIAEEVGFSGEILTDPRMPDGAPRKLLDTSLINSTGWQHTIGLKDGLAAAYHDFKSTLETGQTRL